MAFFIVNAVKTPNLTFNEGSSVLIISPHWLAAGSRFNIS
jgi:hypothetical protein